MSDSQNQTGDEEDDPEADIDEVFAGAAPDDIEYLFAQTASGVALGSDDSRIVLKGVSPSTLYFSDRPHRLTGHVPTDDFVASWGVGDDSFADDPPNAVLSIIDGDEVNDVVVVLSDPQLRDGGLSYAVEVTEGHLMSSNAPASLIIDMIGRPMTATSVAGVRRRGGRRGRRRMRRRMR